MVAVGGGVREGLGVPPQPFRPPGLGGRPFLGSVAMRDGVITRGQLRSSGWRRMFRDVYVDARVPDDHRVRVLGAALLLPDGAVVAGRSAAHLYGATLAAPTDPVEVVTTTPFGPVAGLRIRQHQLRPTDRRRYTGTPVTTTLATGYELARSLPLEQAVVWVDALAHTRALSRRDLLAHCADHLGETGWRIASQALALCDPRAESPPESRVRLWLTLAGLPPPVPQYHVLDSFGEFVARVDLAWPRLRIAVEYDGHWHADPGQLGRDRRRLRTLNALGWYVYPVTAADLHDPPALVTALRTLLTHHTLTRPLI